MDDGEICGDPQHRLHFIDSFMFRWGSSLRQAHGAADGFFQRAQWAMASIASSVQNPDWFMTILGIRSEL